MRGGYVMDKIKVLWMNNGDEDLNVISKDACCVGICLQTCLNMGDFRKHLSNGNFKEWQAVMVNADYKLYVKREKKYIRKVNNLDDDIRQIIRENGIPCFVVTDNDKVNPAVKLAFKSFTKEFFLLQNSKYLFERIKSEVNEAPEMIIRKKYARICNYCTEYRLIKLLLKLEGNDDAIQADTTVPNECRKMLEWVKGETFFKSKNLSEHVIDRVEKRTRTHIEALTYGELDLNQFSNAIDCTNSEVIPEYVKRSFHHCCNITQPASHHTAIDQLIGLNKVPYVNKSLIFDLLNIIYWCANQNQEKV